MPILHFPRAFIQIFNVLEDNNIRVPQFDKSYYLCLRWNVNQRIIMLKMNKILSFVQESPRMW